MNDICLSGRLTADPEIFQTQSGKSVCRFAIAVQRPNVKDTTDFINCVAWNGTAEFVNKYFGKGEPIELSGYLTSRKYKDKSGSERICHEVICDRVSFVLQRPKQAVASEQGTAKKADGDQISPEDFEEILSDDGVPFL